MKTCSICLGQITVLDTVKKNVKTLTCKHKFHRACIDAALTRNRRSCPICNGYVLNDVEQTLFDCRTTQQMTALASATEYFIPSLNAVELYKNRYSSVATDTMLNFVLKNVDLTDLFLYALRVVDKELVRRILTTNRLNWHKTVNGLPLIEEALKIGAGILETILQENREIRLPFQFATRKYAYIYPSLGEQHFADGGGKSGYNKKFVDDVNLFNSLPSTVVPSAPPI